MTGSMMHGLVGLLAWGQLTNAQDIITDDTVFYGQSPPVYPSPNGTGSGGWGDSYTKARAFVGQLTLEEKVNLTGGITSSTGCSGFLASIPRLNFPGLCLSDAGNGLRSADYVSAWAAGWSVGASWNRELAHERAVGMGQEFYKKGSNVLLGPVVGPLGRIASSGRNWEGFSNDPYLTGQLAYETVVGVQSAGVITSHFIGNEQETNRNPDGNVSSVSSNIDDKTIHELYLWPFQDTVKAGTGNIMSSYNKLNNSWACDNSYTQNGLLKTELGFQGFVVSDWFGQHSGVVSALAGLDMVMPSGATYWGANLVEAVNNGSVPEVRVDDMATRIIAAWYQMGQDSSDLPVPGSGIPEDLSQPHTRVIGWNTSFKDTLYRGALEGHVLLKNEGALPFKSPELISLFGYSAKTPDQYNVGTFGFNGGSYPLAYGLDYNGTGSFISGVTSGIARNGTIISGGGSGASQPPWISSPFQALTERAQEDLTALYWDFHSTNPYVDATSDACIVDVNVYATEGSDRPSLRDDYTDSIILNVAANCSNTIVIFQNSGVRLVDQFIDHPNVTALVFAHVPGQDSGKALVSLLYGDENFSGKLPYSVPRNESDYAGLQNATQPDGIYTLFPQSDFSEGVYIDYRAFDAKNITPRYEFGFGLSYTSFDYSDLTSAVSSNVSTDEYPTGEVLEGGQVDLWDVVATVSATVTNAGNATGAEIAQLYVGIAGGPVKQLRGFEKPVLEAGQSATVEFALTRRDLSTWDVTVQKWLLQKGDYQIYVGSSSRDLPLTGTLTI